METINRIFKHLKTYPQKYPDCWKLIDSFRSGRGDPLDNWPNWCYCPLAGAAAVITRGDNNNAKNPFYAIDVGALGALATWRVSQGIYRFDKTILNALISTEMDALPIEIFYRLPEWCVYIEVDYHINFLKCSIMGFFCHLEYDINSQQTELRLLLDTGERLIAIPLHLKSTLVESLSAAYAQSMNHLNINPTFLPSNVSVNHASDLAPLISLVLYLCSENQDTTKNDVPVLPGNRFPTPKKVKSGLRLFAPDKPSFYEVGFNIGNKLRSYVNSAGNSHEGPRPHIRRAHWHTFLTGPRSAERYKLLKWLPPLPVNFESDIEIVPTIKKISK